MVGAIEPMWKGEKDETGSQERKREGKEKKQECDSGDATIRLIVIVAKLSSPT